MIVEENGKLLLPVYRPAIERTMDRFVGEYTAKVDDKGRVVFPAAFKNCMAGSEDLKFVIRKENFSLCLEMFTSSEWDRQAEEVRAKINPAFNRKHADLWRAYMYNSATVEPDAKFGRISIPKKLMEMIGIQKEVVFYGVGYKIEIWAKENFESGIISSDEFVSMLSDLA